MNTVIEEENDAREKKLKHIKSSFSYADACQDVLCDIFFQVGCGLGSKEVGIILAYIDYYRDVYFHSSPVGAMNNTIPLIQTSKTLEPYIKELIYSIQTNFQLIVRGFHYRTQQPSLCCFLAAEEEEITDFCYSLLLFSWIELPYSIPQRHQSSIVEFVACLNANKVLLVRIQPNKDAWQIIETVKRKIVNYLKKNKGWNKEVDLSISPVDNHFIIHDARWNRHQVNADLSSILSHCLPAEFYSSSGPTWNIDLTYKIRQGMNADSIFDQLRDELRAKK